MKLTIEKFTKKFNLHLIEETKVEEVEVEQAIGINSISYKKEDRNNFIAIMRAEDTIEGQEEKINLIIISELEELTDEIKNKFIAMNKPVLYTNFSKREVIATIDSYLLRKQQNPERLHATMLSIFGEGVLIMGKSGIGKSEVALELINRKHLFIGDDAIDVISFAGTPHAKAPKLSRDFIEVRGVGIVNVKGMYGIQSMVKEHKVDLIIELVNLDDVKSSVERLGREYSSRIVSGVEIPLIQVPVSSGRAIAPVIETATIAFKQRMQENYIAANDLTERLRNS